jgi:hypothetical protein
LSGIICFQRKYDYEIDGKIPFKERRSEAAGRTALEKLNNLKMTGFIRILFSTRKSSLFL